MADNGEEKRRAALSPWHPATILATGFYTGLLPRAPGTWGSLLALPVAWLIMTHYTRFWLLVAAAVVFAIGCWAAGLFAKRNGRPDPGPVVIDEVAGQMLTLAFAPLSLPGLAVGFVMFRFFDIVKPWPASWADRKLKGGFGIMLDDIFAAIYAGATLYVFHRLVIADPGL